MGDRFGQYEILRKIAAGGMAEVLLAKQVGIGGFERLVCLKRILPHLAEEEDFVKMFMDEARIVANLTHPNIAQIYDIGQSGDHLYIAMEYVRGEDLRHIYNQEVARGHPMPQEIAAHIAMGCAAGLDYAHRQTAIDGRPLGIVHRDISPQNILVTYDGHVKIVDFGVAKATGKMAQTRAGVLKGKYSYMSPEQASGDPIDGRTDVFALGVTLYEITTGTRLFKRENELETLHAVLGCQVTPPRKVRRAYHDELSQIVLKALAGDAEERFQSAGDMERAIERYLLARNHPPGPSSLGTYMQELFADKLADELLFGSQNWQESDTPSPSNRQPGSPPGSAPDGREAVKTGRGTSATRVLCGNDPQAPEIGDRTGATRVDTDGAAAWSDGEENPTREVPSAFASPEDWGLQGDTEAVTVPHTFMSEDTRETRPSRPSTPTPTPSAGTGRSSRLAGARSRSDLFMAGAGITLAATIIGGVFLLRGNLDNLSPAGSRVVDLTPSPNPNETLPNPPLQTGNATGDRPPTRLHAGNGADDGAADTTAASGEETAEQPDGGLPDARAQAEPSETAWLTVLATQFPMIVSTKGRRLGETPLRRAPLEPGVHRLRLTSKAEGVSVKRRVKLEAGRHETLHINLGRGALVVNATPWAWVRIGRRLPRETPLRISVHEGEYNVVFECPKGRRYTKTISVPRDAMATAVVVCDEDD